MANTKTLKHFRKGQSGNRAGRPKGSKNKLAEAFWSDFAAAWEEHGATALERVATEEPAKFVAVAASMMPKEVQVDVTETMTLEQLDAKIAELAAQLGLKIEPIAGPEDDESTPSGLEHF
jgi:hypothetical protein